MPVQDRMTRWWIPPEMWRCMQPLNLEFSNRWAGTPPVDGRLVSSCDLWYLVMFHSWIKSHGMDEWTNGGMDEWTGTDKLDERFFGSCFHNQGHRMTSWMYMNLCQTDCQTVSLPSCPSNSMILAPLSIVGPPTSARLQNCRLLGDNSFLMVPQTPTTSTLDGVLRATCDFFLSITVLYLLILTKDDAVKFFVPRVCVPLTLLAVQEALQKCEALESLLADERMRLMSRVEEARSCREREDTKLGRCPFIGNIQGRVIFHWGKWQLQEEEGWGWRSNPYMFFYSIYCICIYIYIIYIYNIYIWFHHGDGWESQLNNQTLRFPKLLPKWDKSCVATWATSKK